MAQGVRNNSRVLTWLTAGAVTVATWFGLTAMHVRPGWLAVTLAALAGVLTLATSELGVLMAVFALSLPLVAAQPILGLGALVVGIVAVRYLGADGGRAFLVIAVSLIGAFFGPVWAGAALAGYLLGSGEGALAAAVACVIVEAVGFGLGRPALGVTMTGGPVAALLGFQGMPATLLSADWLRQSFSTLGTENVNLVVGTIASVKSPAALVVQPALWAVGGMVAGLIGAESRKRSSLVMSMVAVCAGVLIPAVGSVLVRIVLGLPQLWSATAIATVSSLAVAVAFVAVWEQVFALQPSVAPAAPSRRLSMASEDADVDELLRLIASAEDQLQSQHTTTKIVMITDMKSFSRMTEEDGSVVTAKAIQRHRDLLIPILEQSGGKGKSTGGDGLVAAFETAAQAVSAASQMQRALVAHNAAHPNEREIWVRMGLASGEVVLDKGGRPFIGAALNLAARVMNLADGGQVFATSEVADAANVPGATPYSFGEFELKNIAKPVGIVEILWEEGQKPRDPRDQMPASDS